MWPCGPSTKMVWLERLKKMKKMEAQGHCDIGWLRNLVDLDTRQMAFKAHPLGFFFVCFCFVPSLVFHDCAVVQTFHLFST